MGGSGISGFSSLPLSEIAAHIVAHCICDDQGMTTSSRRQLRIVALVQLEPIMPWVARLGRADTIALSKEEDLP